MGRKCYLVFLLALVFLFPFPNPKVSKDLFSFPKVDLSAISQSCVQSHRQLISSFHNAKQELDRIIFEAITFLKELKTYTIGGLRMLRMHIFPHMIHKLQAKR